jgi:CheY-like chemotaxis protein
MGFPLPGESQPPESGPVVRGERDPDAALVLADGLKTPLAVVIANLQLLADLVTSVQSEATREGGLRSDFAGWLTIRLAGAESYLADAHGAAERLREIVAPKEPLPQGANERALPTKGDRLRPARILIVDDDESVARALQRVFRDYDAVVNIGARHALDRIIIGERFDVILSDVTMPRMSGCDLYDEIHRVAPEQASRIVFVTGGLPDQRTENALAAIGQPVLMKPFNPQELRAFIEKFLR